MTSQQITVSIIGLDTSHSVEFARRMQAPDCPLDQKVAGMQVTSCLRFATPFLGEEGLNERQKQLEAWGILVTTDFDEAAAGCDAIMIEINDPAYHLEYFRKCAGLGKPVFLDKPLAGNLEDALEIRRMAEENNIRVLSCSSLRFVPQLTEACAALPRPQFASVYGCLGRAPAGSSIIWYGVHVFEMLQRATGPGAVSVTAFGDDVDVVSIVEYPDGRRGVVEMDETSGVYGGVLRGPESAVPFAADMSRIYSDQLEQIAGFFRGSGAPATLRDAVEIIAMMEATEQSLRWRSRVDIESPGLSMAE